MLKNLALVLTSIIICLFLLETGLRLLNGLPLIPDRNFIVERAHIVDLNNFPVAEYHPMLGWVHRPNLRFNSDNLNESFTTGDEGVRMNQPEIRPIPKNAILAVGDSFTAGSEVGDAQTWPAQLEREIGEAVINAAVGAWGTDQIILRAEQLIAKFAPRMIIVSFISGDAERSRYRVYGGMNKSYFDTENGVLVPMNQPVPKPTGPGASLTFLQKVFGYSYLLDFTMSHLGVESWFRVAQYVTVQVDPIRVTCLLLDRLKQESDAKNIRLLFLMQFGGNDISQANQRPSEAIEVLNCARKAGIQTVDSWEPLKSVYARGEEQLKALYNMLQGGNVYYHMSPAGNKFIADLLAQAVRAQSFTTKDEPGTPCVAC
jgi:hypothetical protein